MSRINRWPMCRFFSLGAVLAMALLAGCDETTPGAGENVAFTPDNCGLLLSGCDFAETLGEGGAVDVRISGVGDFDVTGVSLQSNNTEVFTVMYLGLVNGHRTWQLDGTGPGTARLIARKGGAQVDYIEIEVQEVTGLLVKSFLTDLDEVPDVTGFDRYFLIEPEDITSVYMVAAVGDDQIMGRYEYLYEIVDTSDADEVPEYGIIDPEFEGYIDDLDDLERGQLTFTVPAGAPSTEYRATFAPAYYEGDIDVRIGLGIL